MRLFQVDAFTATPFKGNPAGVCVLDEPADEEWMARLAAEMNLSETAYVHPRGEAGFALRWFTPTVEVDLCGHATLATAHVLWELGHKGALQFHTRSGLLQATREEGEIQLDFPALVPVPTEPPAGLLEALGCAGEVLKSRFDYLVVVQETSTLSALDPDLSRLKEVEARGVIVSCRSHLPDYDFISRFFAPRAGVNEDPVTGSAHCVLTPYWAGVLGKSTMRALQASQRTGELTVTLEGQRVRLRGQAVTVFEALLRNF